MWFGKWLAKRTGGFFVDRLVLNVRTVTLPSLRFPSVHYLIVTLAEKRILFSSDIWIRVDLLETTDSEFTASFFFPILSPSFDRILWTVGINECSLSSLTATYQQFGVCIKLLFILDHDFCH